MLSELATRRGSEEGGNWEKGKWKGNHAHIRDKGGNRFMKVNE